MNEKWTKHFATVNDELFEALKCPKPLRKLSRICEILPTASEITLTLMTIFEGCNNHGGNFNA